MGFEYLITVAIRKNGSLRVLAGNLAIFHSFSAMCWALEGTIKWAFIYVCQTPRKDTRSLNKIPTHLILLYETYGWSVPDSKVPRPMSSYMFQDYRALVGSALSSCHSLFPQGHSSRYQRHRHKRQRANEHQGRKILSTVKWNDTQSRVTITLYELTLDCITKNYIQLNYIKLRYITSHYIILHYNTLQYVTLHSIPLHYITSQYIP